MTFAGGSVTNGTEANLISIYGKIFQVTQFFDLRECLGSISQPKRAWNMCCSRRESGSKIFSLYEVQEFAVFPNELRSKMGIHIPACAMGIIQDIRVCIKLGKKFFDGGCAQCKSERLVAIITGIKIAGLKKFCDGYLG